MSIKISLDNADFSSKRIINSPRSIQACNELGIDPHELNQLTIDEFILNNPECKNLSKNIQQERYKHYDKLRLLSIEQVKSKRNEIINKETFSFLLVNGTKTFLILFVIKLIALILI